ncbi:TRAF family member-associated NF-kappa-B activator isoform X2 [Siniperca chuatsi]|uniref:TRAF family member-associated NF-kappa-B activator isoform X2 n=1 Tax=Siniperca chuatsi TaxID=119488 RepID=UPI001CE0B5CB|nr:TRAF family member-associated NF-kappa-B activator isoform X2 [Siniperca chuatsi]
MERNIGDQLNKAFEAYRQVSIEKDNAKKELQQMEKMGTVAVAPNMPVNSSVDYQDMLDAFEAIQGKFRQIRSLTRRQKDHLKRFHGGNDTSNDQWFSMPIQCTDRTEEAETPFSSTLRSAVDIPLPPTSLASRGASPEDRDLVDSLTKLSVKFPPSADSEYDFLNSAPERHIGLTMPMKQPLRTVPSTLTEEEPVELPMPFVYPTPPSHSTSSSLSQESVRGPQQPLWSPELCDAVDAGTELATPQSSSPNKCAFCHAVVPQDRMNSHLYSHFSPKNEADN